MLAKLPPIDLEESPEDTKGSYQKSRKDRHCNGQKK